MTHTTLRETAVPSAAEVRPAPGAGGATGGDAPALAGLSPLDGEGGAVDYGAAPPEPLFKGVSVGPLRGMTEQEIRDLTPDEFMAAQLADNCVECPEAPRSTCPHRSRCDAETYG